MFTKVLLIGALVAQISLYAAAKTEDDNVPTDSHLIPARRNSGWHLPSLNPLNLLWWAIGANAQTAENAAAATTRSLRTAQLAEGAADDARRAASSVSAAAATMSGV